MNTYPCNATPIVVFRLQNKMYNWHVLIANKAGAVAVGVKIPAIIMCLSLGWKVTPRGFVIWPFKMCAKANKLRSRMSKSYN